MNKNFAIVIQGPSNHIFQIKKWWGSGPIIYSTWKGEEASYDLNNDIVVFNERPSDPGPANFWMQQKSTIHGLYKAKELGYRHVLKMRSDMVPTSADTFLNSLVPDKLNFFCWHAHEVYPDCPGYLTDYFMSGPIDDLIELWNIEKTFCVVPEIMITWQYIKNLSNKIPINYLYESINENNDIHWIKRNVKLSSYKTPIMDPYNKFTFNMEVKHIKDNYINFLKGQ